MPINDTNGHDIYNLGSRDLPDSMTACRANFKCTDITTSYTPNAPPAGAFAIERFCGHKEEDTKSRGSRS